MAEELIGYTIEPEQPELTADEVLVFATAWQKGIRQGLDQLRATMDADAIAEYKERGVKTRDLMVGGVKMGTQSITVKKGRPAMPAQARMRVIAGATAEWMEYLKANGLTREVPAADWESRFVVDADTMSVFDAETGEKMGWATVEWTPATAAEEPTIGVQVRTESIDKVVAAFGDRLPMATRYLLGDGEE